MTELVAKKLQVGERSRRGGSGRRLLRGVYVLWLIQLHKFVSSPLEIGSTLFTPTLWMVLFGVCMGNTAQELNRSGTSLNYIAFITPGVMLLTALSAAIMGGTTLLLGRLQGTLKGYLVAPVPRLAILVGTLTGGLTKALGQALVVLLLGLGLGAGFAGGLGGLLVGLGLLTLYTLGFVGLASALACRARGMESYHSLIILLNLPVLFVSNALYPLEKMPELIRWLAFLNPTTYAIDATRHFFFGASSQLGTGLDTAVLTGFMLGGLAWGYRVFRQTSRNLGN